jgi:hypothetical protein
MLRGAEVELSSPCDGMGVAKATPFSDHTMKIPSIDERYTVTNSHLSRCFI